MAERKQIYHSSLERKKTAILCVLIAVVIAVVGAVFFMTRNKNPKQTEYVPPAFEENVLTLDESIIADNNIKVTETDNGFAFALSPDMKLNKDGTLTIYTANVGTNIAYLQYIIADADTNEVLYRTGVLKPNEYVRDLKPIGKVEQKSYNLLITVNAFEPDTWYSKGKLPIKFTLENFEQ